MGAFQQARPHSVQKIHQEDFRQQGPAFDWGLSTLRLQMFSCAGGTRPPAPQLTRAKRPFPVHQEVLRDELQNREKKELPCLDISKSSSRIHGALPV